MKLINELKSKNKSIRQIKKSVSKKIYNLDNSSSETINSTVNNCYSIGIDEKNMYYRNHYLTPNFNTISIEKNKDSLNGEEIYNLMHSQYLKNRYANKEINKYKTSQYVIKDDIQKLIEYFQPSSVRYHLEEVSIQKEVKTYINQHNALVAEQEIFTIEQALYLEIQSKPVLISDFKNINDLENTKKIITAIVHKDVLSNSILKTHDYLKIHKRTLNKLINNALLPFHAHLIINQKSYFDFKDKNRELLKNQLTISIKNLYLDDDGYMPKFIPIFEKGRLINFISNEFYAGINNDESLGFANYSNLSLLENQYNIELCIKEDKYLNKNIHEYLEILDLNLVVNYMTLDCMITMITELGIIHINTNVLNLLNSIHCCKGEMFLLTLKEIIDEESN
ncbi:hypothetical protein ACTXGU_09065 [Niallia sp. 01092]|uniref:hypothetical protein n=1 Tax=Niallia sp. 01092 TaxID=3457759 RepID=UPI003FD10FC1